MLLLGITLYYTTISKWKSIFVLTISYTLFIALLYSETRSGWVGSFIGFVILLLFILRKRRELLKKAIILSSGFALIFLTVNVTEENGYISRVSSIYLDGNKVLSGNDEGHAGASRWFIWKNAFPLILNHPFLGSGPDTFAEVFVVPPEEKREFLGDEGIIVDKAHNEYLQIAVTMGIPALITYLFLLFLIIRSAWKAAARTNDATQQILCFGLGVVIIGYVVQAFFNISVIEVAPFFWMLLGVTYCYSEEVLKLNNVKTKST
ncbi:O-antigen ligase family protein [Schinkia sp. CFF1]